MSLADQAPGGWGGHSLGGHLGFAPDPGGPGRLQGAPCAHCRRRCTPWPVASRAPGQQGCWVGLEHLRRLWGLVESFVWRSMAAGWFLDGPFKASLSKDGRGVSVSLEEGE